MDIGHLFVRMAVVGICVGVAGCAKNVEPRLPKNTVLAAYSDGKAIAQSGVSKAFESVVSDQVAVLKKHFAQQKSALTNQFDHDFLRDYCGIAPERVTWSLVTVGPLTRREKSKKPLIPLIAVVVHATLEKEAVLAQLNQRLAQKDDAGRLVAGELDGTPIWRLVHKDLSLADGFAPCLAFIGKTMLVLASHEDSLKEQLALYAGKQPALGVDAALSQTIHLPKGVVSRMMIGDIQGLLQKVMTEEERKSATETPYVATLMKTVQWTAIDVSLVEQPQAMDLVWRVGCADEQGAQAVNEMLITVRTSMKMGLGFIIKDKPNLKPVLTWLERINLRAAGKEASLVIHATPDDVKNLDLVKLLDR